MRVLACAALLCTLWGCSTHAVPPVSWDAEAVVASGEVLVLPVLELHDAPLVNLDHHVVAEVPFSQQIRREVRTQMLQTLPVEVAAALPGAVNGQVGRGWDGRFRPGSFPVGSDIRLSHALARPGADVDQALAQVGQRSGSDAVWITWVRRLHGAPLTAQGFVGDLVHTTTGPVVIDLTDEPYLVELDVGVALVSGQGEVLLRYEDRFEGVLSRHTDAPAVGRAVAKDMAGQVALLWPGEVAVEPAAEELVAWGW